MCQACLRANHYDNNVQWLPYSRAPIICRNHFVFKLTDRLPGGFFVRSGCIEQNSVVDEKKKLQAATKYHGIHFHFTKNCGVSSDGNISPRAAISCKCTHSTQTSLLKQAERKHNLNSSSCARARTPCTLAAVAEIQHTSARILLRAFPRTSEHH